MTKIPTIEEMKEKAETIGKNFPDIEGKKWVTQIRGYVIEFAISIERSLNVLITETGQDLVFYPEKKEFYLVKGIKKKKELPKFKTKTRDMIKLIEKIMIENNHVPETSNIRDAFDKLEEIRDIFAHVPLNFDSELLKFDICPPYKHFFKDPRWEDVNVCLNEFIQSYHYLTDVILNYSRHISIKKEIYSQILLGMSIEEFDKKVKQEKG